MRVEVEVTQEDIDEGSPFSCWDCPVARALERALGYPVEVDGNQWNRRMLSEQFSPAPFDMNPMPMNVQAFIRGFDLGDVMTPFTFTVEVPES